MSKTRRCNLFDDNGRPRRLKDGTMGCYRDASACHFTHPHEREWEAADSSYPPKHEAVIDSDSDFYYSLTHANRFKDHRERDKEKERGKDRDKTREREWDKERRKNREKSSSSFHPESPSHQRDSVTTRGSSGPHSRRSTFDSIGDPSSTVKRGRSPSRSTPRRSRSRSRDKIRDKERADLPSKMPPVPAQIPIAPPEPPKSPLMQPPPPPHIPEVPKLPSFAASHQPSSASCASEGMNGLSLDEQRAAWHERIDLMFSSITSRRDYAKLESDLSRIRLLANSSFMDTIPEPERDRMHAQKMLLEVEMEVKRKEINEVIQKLIRSEFWPVLKTSQIAELEKMLVEAKKHVLEVRSMMDNVKSSCTALLKANVADETQDSERPSKRRKVEEDDNRQSTNEDAQEVLTEQAAKEFEALRDKLVKLDGHLAELQNEITQRDHNISQEIEDHIDARLQEEDALYSPVNKPTKVSQVEIEAVVDARTQHLVRAVTTTGEDIGTLALEVADLITKVNALEARCQVLEAEKQEFKNKLEQDSFDYAKSHAALILRDKEIEAIAAALQAYISQAPNQLPSEPPSPEYIIDSLDSQLHGIFREKFAPALADVQREVLDRVQDTHNQTVNTVSPNIKLLLKMVHLISARVGNSDVDAANTS